MKSTIQYRKFSGQSSVGCVLSISIMLLATVPNGYAAAATRTLSGPVQQADDYYLGRRNLDNVRTSLHLLRQEVAEHPNDYEAWWRISMFTCYLARHAPAEEMMDHLAEGAEAGRNAVALSPDSPEGHFWLGANLGLTAEKRSFLKALSLVDSIRKEMETVMRLDPDYEQAAGMRTLGRLDYRAPFFKGGDKRRSVELLQQSLERFPKNSMTMLYLADSYLALGRRKEAFDLLEQILNLCPDPLYGPEQEENQEVARERLARWTTAGN
jgi:tetratricopeptide (TPR) repeat protein